MRANTAQVPPASTAIEIAGFSQAAKLVHPRQGQPFFRRRRITSVGLRPAGRFADREGAILMKGGGIDG
jgi:hypothetical protein